MKRREKRLPRTYPNQKMLLVPLMPTDSGELNSVEAKSRQVSFSYDVGVLFEVEPTPRSMDREIFSNGSNVV